MVAVMFLSQLIFVTILLAVLSHAETVADNQERYKLVSQCGEDLMQHFFGAAKGLFVYYFTPTPELRTQFDRSCKALESDVGRLEKLVGNNPSQQEPLRRIKVLVPESITLMKAARQKFEKGGTPIDLLGVASLDKKVESITDQLVKQVAIITNAEKDEQHWQPQEKQRARFAIRVVFIVGVLASGVIAVLVVIFYGREISTRIGTMADNSVRLAAGRQLHPLVSGSDEITELDKTFHDMADALAEAKRIKAEFASMISHDLRAPLTSVQLTLGLLSSGVYGELNELGQDRVAAVETSTANLIRLTNELLEIERSESGKLPLSIAETPFGTVLKQAVESVRPAAERAKITIISAHTDCLVNVDEHRIVQVLTNILSNAIKFSQERTQITIEVLEKDKALEVRITDQGRGIPESQKNSIFNRFHQVQDTDSTQKKGFGLGLSICKAIIDQHGGEIGVDSQEGIGSTFWFTIPRA